jgi:hypothetical protein
MLNRGVEVFEGCSQRTWEGVRIRHERRGVRAEDAQLESAVEEGHAQSFGGEGVTVGAGLSLNKAAKAESSQVVRHLGRGVGLTEQRGDPWTEIAVAKTRRQMGEAAQCLTERLNARVAKPPRGNPPRAQTERLLESIEGGDRERAILADPFDGE